MNELIPFSLINKHLLISFMLISFMISFIKVRLLSTSPINFRLTKLYLYVRHHTAISVLILQFKVRVNFKAEIRNTLHNISGLQLYFFVNKKNNYKNCFCNCWKIEMQLASFCQFSDIIWNKMHIYCMTNLIDKKWQ